MTKHDYDTKDFEPKQSLSLINKKASFSNNAAFCFSAGNGLKPFPARFISL